MQTADNFYVGEWLVEARLNRLTGQAGPIAIEPKMMQVLICLAEFPGELVDREALLDSVWQDTFVTDHVLNRSVSQLRKIFEDDARKPQFIETIPKAGYRLIAPVRYGKFVEEPVAAEFSLNGYTNRHRTKPSLASRQPSSAPVPKVSSRRLSSRRMVLFVLSLGILVTGALTIASMFPSQNAPGSLVEVVPLTSFIGQEVQPALSPDGKYLAFVWEGEQENNLDVYLKLIGTDTVLRLTNHPGADLHPTWSPDGQHIAFRRTEQEACGLYIMSALGGPARKMTDCQNAQWSLDWSPDGQWLVVAGNDSINTAIGIHLISLETLEKQRITTPPLHHIQYHPKFSPDGTTVALLQSKGRGISDLYVLPLALDQKPRRLTVDNHVIVNFEWSQDGHHLLFSSNRTGSFKLWRVAIGGGAPQPIQGFNTYDPGRISLDASGRRLVYVEWFYEANIWASSVTMSSKATPDTRRVVASTHWDFAPVFSPDGTRIAFVSNRTGSYELWISQSDGSNPVRITAFDGPLVNMPQWAPNSRQIVFEMQANSNTDLYVVDTADGIPRLLTTNATHDLVPSWSRDGRWIYFGSNRSGAWQVWKIPSQGGPPEQVTWQGGYRAFESLDGTHLYYSKLAEPGLWSRPVDGGDARQMLEVLSARDWGNWTLTNEGIYFIDRETSDPSIALLDLQTGTIKPMVSLAGKTLSFTSGLSVSPDGKLILYALADRSESDIMLVEDFLP